MTDPSAYALFKVDNDALRRLLKEALSRGGEYADLFFEHRVSSSLQMEDDLIKSAARNGMRGVGIRVVQGDQVGFAYTDSLLWEDMVRAARTAGYIAQGSQGSQVADLNSRAIHSLYEVPVAATFAQIESKLDLMRRANAAARDHSASIQKVKILLTDEHRTLLFANSDGVTWNDAQPLLRFDVTTLAEEGGLRQNGYSGGGGRFGLDYFDVRAPEDTAREAVRLALLNLHAKEAPAGQMPVVLGAGDSGILLHEAVGHGLEADFNRKGLSNYSGELGRPVASPLCTVVDSGLFPGSRGSINVDDEGNLPEETVLIEGGVLRGYLQDRISAKLTGAATTGNGRRDSYACVPLPRMTNTYLLPGESDPEEILRSVKRGIYAKRFGGGQVDITKGDYVFSVTEGYLIEDGVVTTPLKNITLIGNGPESMRNVSMVGRDLEHSDGIWTCGKHGQTVPVGVGMPTIRIEDMTVGGTEH